MEGKTVSSATWKALLKISIVYFECVLDITRAYLHGTAIREKQEKTRLAKTLRRRVIQSDVTKNHETTTREKERFKSFFQPKEVSEAKEVRADPVPAMINDDAAIGAVVTGTQEKVVSTVATKSISRSDRTKVSKNKDGVRKSEKEQLANRLRSFLTAPSSKSDTVTQDTSASSGNPRWHDGSKVESDSIAAQDNEDVFRDQDQHRDQQHVRMTVREAQTMLTPNYWGKPSDWPKDPLETTVASEPVLESVNEERRSERIATARTQELVAQTVSRVTIEHFSRQLPEEEEWTESCDWTSSCGSAQCSVSRSGVSGVFMC
jgi:hypothetical protein